ncbi:Alpha/beta hydrolase fold protein [Caballeronia calidae]|uniref:Alpha/beta hydrolase fold protein n=1 Tax=Caballeronia calidae TaxID=1777139 RepID=A0A158EFF0_9BURK|nr:alpha/beta hydrolase [Caballeronia calidae]SAL05621.1 Alpha/beta hydrolase fold protein [Caballeronia calidae]
MLLHGGGQTRHAWRKTARWLAKAGYHVLTYDARGHGESDWASEGQYDQDAFVRDLTCIARQTKVKRPALMGASMGGNTCLTAVGERWMEVSALVLIDAVPQTRREGFERIKAFMEEGRRGFESLDAVVLAISAYRGEPTRRPSMEGLAKTVRLGSDGRYYWHWDPNFLEERERDFDARYDRLSACAKHLEIPTLVARGGSSDVVSEEGIKEFLRLCPQAEYLNIAEAGHMITGDENDTFGRATIDFLGRNVPASATQ